MRIKNILDYKLVTKLFGFSRQSWNNWKKEERPIISLLEKYFTDDELVEFLETGEIAFLEERKATQNKSSHFQRIYKEIEELKKRINDLENKECKND